MGKGVILKNKDKENIYPMSSSDLIYDPITKKTVKSELGEKVEEAPQDDKQYARINGTWAEVEAGAVSEVALISLTPTSSELNGASVVVTSNEGETLLNTTWNGAQLSVQVKAGLQYTVAVGDVDGFITPESVTYTAVKGATRSVNMAYIESRLTVQMLSNQSNDTTLDSIKATVTYGSTSVQVANGGTVNFPLNVDVTITFPSVDGYKTPDTISYTHTNGGYTKTGTYYTEVVSVTLSAENDADVSGQVVTINGTSYTWNGTTITQKVAFGTSYTVSVNDKDGYITPDSQTYTAAESVRNLSFIYAEFGFGVYIQGVSGKLYTVDRWSSQETANGIAVITENCSFVMALESAYTYNCEWGGYDTLIEGITTTESYSEAEVDYAGQSNTEKIISQLGSTASSAAGSDSESPSPYAAECCANYVFPNGKSGYLGAAGEWSVVAYNYSDIEDALSACGGDTSIFSILWTSTQSSAKYSWYVSVSEGIEEAHKSSYHYAFAFCSIEI